jgi:hypothetical protein
MPMRQMLEGGSFDPKAVATFVEVFETVTTELDLHDVADRERAAKIIIGLARGKPTLDGAELGDKVLRLMRIDGRYVRSAARPTRPQAGRSTASDQSPPDVRQAP